MNIIIETAEGASEAIFNVTGAIETMQDNVDIQEYIGRLNSTTSRLNQGAADIQRQAKKNRRWVNKGLKILYSSLSLSVSLSLKTKQLSDQHIGVYQFKIPRHN